MKLYTKKGDSGKTSLLGGARVAKCHIRVRAYGDVDELNAYIGLLRDVTENRERQALLIEIQDRLFTMGSMLALESDDQNIRIPELSDNDVVALEEAIDAMDQLLPPLKTFILPGGHRSVSFCHIARCVCRRAERSVVELSESSSVAAVVPKYLNRLSDFLFMLSRMLMKESGAEEIPWKGRLS